MNKIKELASKYAIKHYGKPRQWKPIETSEIVLNDNIINAFIDGITNFINNGTAFEEFEDQLADHFKHNEIETIKNFKKWLQEKITYK